MQPTPPLTHAAEGGAKLKSTGRNFGLDLLRTLAIVIVLTNHYFIGFYFGTGRVAVTGLAKGVSAASVLAIEWLFVLSGFLIGAMMIRSFETRATWRLRARDFWLRRWFRTLPNYYLFLLVNVLLSAYGIGSGVFDYKFAIFSQNLAWPEAEPFFFGEAWSLASDEWFYLLMPILLGLASLLPRSFQHRSFLIATAALIIVPSMARFLAAVPQDFFVWDASIRRVTVFHLDATGWGVLAAVFSRWHPLAWSRHKVAKAAAGVMLTLIGLGMIEWLVFAGWADTLGFRVFNLLSLVLPAAGAFLFLPWLTTWVTDGALTHWVIDRISLYSYSLYLSHYPVLFLVKAGFDITQFSGIPTMVLASVTWITTTFMVSMLVFRFFEKPTSDLRERFTKKVDASPFSVR